ncbi:ras and EF-hand domain-containing protein [Scomber japonicus]|uniref:ras and EF-hand domain-containing protein n=1 Tax=Scomber japonicus TaxID=13676 RepID=UPI002305D202|nr:ras and EF-hand domain-containing protein [Scomber japonicus]
MDESSVQSGIQSPLDSQPQDDSVSIKAQTHTVFNPTVNRRKMGSSRRHKGRQFVKDSVAVTDMDPKYEAIENTLEEQAFETMKMSSASETKQEEFKEQTDLGLEPTQVRIYSTVNKEDNTENKQEQDTILSENVVDKSAIVTEDKDDSVKSNKEVSEKETKLIEGPTIKMDSMSSINVHISGQDEVGGKCEDHTAQEINVSHEVSHAELLSADTLSTLHIGHEGAEQAVDVSENSGMSNADDAHQRQQGTQDTSDYSENLQIKSKQRRRKLGSTRRDLIRKQEGETTNLDTVQEVAKVQLIVTTHVSQNENAKIPLSTVHKEQQEMNEASAVQDKQGTVHSSTYDLQSTESNRKSGIGDFMAFLPEQSASFSEEVVNAIKYFQVPDTGDRYVVDDVTRFGQDTNEKEDLVQTTEASGMAVADLEIGKSVIRGGAEEEPKNAQADVQEPKDVNEGAHITNFEMKYASPNLNPTNRRRKLGSTRRNLVTQREEVHQKQKADDETTETNIGDVMSEGVSGIKEKELQLQKEHKDSDSEPGKEAVEPSHAGDSYTKPPGHQEVEENPAVSGQLEETEHHLTLDDIPSKLASSPKHDATSESAYGGRRKKLGSKRTSHGHKTAREDRIIETRDVEIITEESGIKILEEHREESGLDKKSEFIESDKTPSSNVSISETGGHSRTESEKTSIRLGQESQSSLSLGDSRGAGRYNVVMIGDSNVGKTSFMKRAQSGKFSFDIPASVGLDSCLWTVVVDGKPVMLQLWDTAGQERFHSITKQIFHKAQAFLLMYDMTSPQSFSAVRYWVGCIQNGAMEDVTILLLGNKSDHAECKVTTHEGEILAKEYNCDFMECSAATGENVVQSLEIVARLLSQKVDTRKEAVVLQKEPPKKKTSGCC